MLVERLITILLIFLVQLAGCGRISGRRDSSTSYNAQKAVVVYTEDDLIQSVKDRDAAKVERVLSAGVSPDARERADSKLVGETALNLSASTGDSEIVVALLKRGANVNGRGYLQRTPLFHAGTTSVASILLDAGADANATDARGETPLMHAPYEIAKLLIERGANVNLTDNDGFTALSVTAEHGETEKIKLLLSAGAEVNARAKNGWTALIAAGARTSPDAAEVLLKHGADPNARMEDGFTALMRAATWNAYRTARALLKYGADPSVEMKDGRTALAIAIGSNNRYGSHKEIIDLLRRGGAK